MKDSVTREQLDSLQQSLKAVIGEPEEEQLNEAEDKESNKDDKEDKEKTQQAAAPPEEPKTINEVYERLKKLGDKGQTLGPNETERHQKAAEHIEGLLEKLHELLGDREAEADEGSDNESSG